MEMLLLGMLPLLLLVLAASMLVVSQISGFFHFTRYKSREIQNRKVTQQFLEQIAVAQAQLSSRGQQLEELSRRLKLNNEELSRLNNMKSKFLSMVVHDVRTPLASIAGYSELLNEHIGHNAKEKRFVANIAQASAQIQHLLEDLTDLAVIEAGKMNMQKVPMDLATFVGDVTPAIVLAAAKKAIVFTVGEIPEAVVLTADRFRLGRVLTNLMGNALKFTPQGGRVELKTRVVGGTVTFFVKDTGPGIHPSERRRIFEKFYQSKFLKDTKVRSAGWGLGLAISDEIVRGHFGEMGVDSQGLGRGSTFWVKVPLIPSRSARPAWGHSSMRAMAVVALVLGVLSGAPRAHAQSLPLEEKAKFENSLEKRVDGVLLRILGPNRSKVVVDATLDFTRIERFEAKEGSATVKVGAKSYLWTAESPTQEEVLPGVPVTPAGGPQAPAARPQSYERRNTFPPEFLKRLAVTIILDRTVTAAQADEVRVIVSDLLEINPTRGDSLTMVNTTFTPVWKTVWYEPETAGMVIKYLLISGLSLLTLVIVALCFLKLAESMSEIAKSQTQSMSMEMKSLGVGDPSKTAALLEGPSSQEKKDKGGQPEEGDLVLFNVRLDQAEALADMLSKEAPANIAIVVTHLPVEVRQEVLKLLPANVSEAVLACLGRVRYLEPEVILNLKEELERRVSGAVGGVGKLVEMISSAEMSKRRQLIDGIRAHDPELADKVRRRVFLLEDLAGLEPGAWSQLHSRIGHEDWAAALSDGPQGAVDALKASIPEGAWKVLEQRLTAKTADAKTRIAAQNKIMQAVTRLVEEGRIPNPLSREPKELTSSPTSPAVPSEQSHG